ncbi:MAG TPA: MoxR family ATPase [Acidobacteriota bacterium]
MRQVEALITNLRHALRGKPEAVELAVVALLSGGHLLIEDVPGVGKTTLARALARSVAGSFRRIQFTSDLLPSDLLGVTVFDTAAAEFRFKPGPVFANIVLADEINRALPKTQSALLEAMNEAQVTVDSATHPLPRPFFVIATQNPFGFHGTYPLPESQLDRFALRLRIGYPPGESERALVRGAADQTPEASLSPVIECRQVVELQRRVLEIQIAEPLIDYILALADATRIHPRLELGLSPRGAIVLRRAAQSRALLRGRGYVTPDDVRNLAAAVIAHRVVARGAIDGGERGEAERAIGDILAQVPVPR